MPSPRQLVLVCAQENQHTLAVGNHNIELIQRHSFIYAFSPFGTRGNDGIEHAELNLVGNLMLVCHDCHRKMDKAPDGGRYTVELLRSWKRQHEERIERVTGINPEMSSRIVLYGANIGEYGSPLTYESTSGALFPDRHPASDQRNYHDAFYSPRVVSVSLMG